MCQSIPKEHHRIPQVYMKKWCIQSNSVQTFNVQTKKLELKNIDNIFITKHYNSYTAGGMNNPDDVNERIFSCLENYKVKYFGNSLNTANELNEHFNDYDNWEISDKDDNKISKATKNEFKYKLIDSKDPAIETLFSRLFENDWNNYIDELYSDVLKDIDIDFRKLCKYVLLFLYRNPNGDENWQNPFLKYITSFLGEQADRIIPENERIYSKDITMYDELVHESNIRRYKEIIEETGAMKKVLDCLSLLCIPTFYIDNSSRFITSDTNVIYSDGCLYFVASPQIFVKIYSKLLIEDKYVEKYDCSLDIKKIEEINKFIFINTKERILYRSIIDVPLKGGNNK